ncbi:hypothetical protein FRB99_006938, partial [Tulasnella sp. 403]
DPKVHMSFEELVAGAAQWFINSTVKVVTTIVEKVGGKARPPAPKAQDWLPKPPPRFCTFLTRSSKKDLLKVPIDEEDVFAGFRNLLENDWEAGDKDKTD